MGNETVGEMLAMFAAIQAAKDAIDRYEQGELNVREALRLIQDATALGRAA